MQGDDADEVFVFSNLRLLLSASTSSESEERFEWGRSLTLEDRMDPDSDQGHSDCLEDGEHGFIDEEHDALELSGSVFSDIGDEIVQEHTSPVNFEFDTEYFHGPSESSHSEFQGDAYEQGGEHTTSEEEEPTTHPPGGGGRGRSGRPKGSGRGKSSNFRGKGAKRGSTDQGRGAKRGRSDQAISPRRRQRVVPSRLLE